MTAPLRAVVLALGAAVAAGGCASTQRPGARAPLPQEVARMRAAAAAVIEQQVRHDWSVWAGEPQPPDAGATADAKWLYTIDSIDLLRRAMRAEPRGDGRRGLHFLHSLLVGEYAARQVRRLDDRVREVERREIGAGGEEIAYEQLPGRLAVEPSAERRREWVLAAVPVVQALRPLLVERRRRLAETAARLGYADTVALASEVRHYEVRPVADLARRLLDASEPLFLSALEEMAPAATGLDPAGLTPADIPFLLGGARFDDAFPPQRVLAAVADTLAGLGFDTDGPAVRVETRDRAGKLPRVACFPLRVPGDIRLAVDIAGGVVDHAGLLYEMGHALPLASSRASTFELRRLGDPSVAEAYALLLRWLADDPGWLAAHFDLSEPALTRRVRFAALRRLLAARRHAALLLYALETAHGLPSRDVYRRHLERAYGFPVGEPEAEHYLADADPMLESADAVRGYVLAGQLEAELERRFGPRWWSSRQAGDWLRALWAPGERLSGEELATFLGAPEIDPQPLLETAARALLRTEPLPAASPASAASRPAQ